MRKVTLLLLTLTIFAACKEQPKPVSPSEWLSQIKSEEAKERTSDVLEKIYASSVYSVAEKDSLSSFHVQVANCQTPKSIEHFAYIFRYLESYTNDNSLEGRGNALMEYISDLYEKDSFVSKAALASMMDTTKIDFGRYFPPFYSKNQDSIINPKTPSKNLLKIEDELIKYMKVLPHNFSQAQTDSIGKIQGLLQKALQDSTFSDYELARIAKDLNLLVSDDKKFFIYSFSYQQGFNSRSATAYANYYEDLSKTSITKEVGSFDCNNDSFMGSAYPLGLFQVEKDGKPLYVVVSSHRGGGIDGSCVVVKSYQIADDRIELCQDCIESESARCYQRPLGSWVVPAFDSTKNEITFNQSWLRYGHIKKIDYDERYEIRKNRRGSGLVMSRMTLKWNGETFISILPKLYYCQE